MKTFLTTAILTLLLVGCADTWPVISKSNTGNLELNVYGPEGEYLNAELYLDGIFIGNLTRYKPIIYAKRGERVVRVEATGFKPYEKTITVLGEPNHQVLNISLEKE